MSVNRPRLATALFDGERLRQARLYHGWRKVEVARQLGISPAAVGQYELGRSRPSQAVLAAMALHLGFQPSFFERGRELTRVEESQAHFRRLRSTSKLERERRLVRIELLAEVVQICERHIKLPAVSIPTLAVDDLQRDAQAEHIAAQVRAEWGLGAGPIDNMVRLLEAKGVVVVRPTIETGDVDAFSTSAGDRPIVVLASDKADCARSRFDAAHELGHLVMHPDVEPGRQSVERQAHRFAAAFLMPAEAIAKELPKRMTWSAYFDLKQRWRVSLQALLYRARTLGALSPDSYQRAQIHLARTWGRIHEPIELGPTEQPVLLQRALELMRNELGIGPQELADRAGLPIDVLTDLLQDAVHREAPKPLVVV